MKKILFFLSVLAMMVVLGCSTSNTDSSKEEKKPETTTEPATPETPTEPSTPETPPAEPATPETPPTEPSTPETPPAEPTTPEEPSSSSDSYSAGEIARECISFDGVIYNKTGEVYVTGQSGATITGAANTNNYAGVFIEGRNVTLSPYIMGKYEVTQQLYTAVMTNQTVTVGENEYTLAASPFICTETGKYPKASTDTQNLRPADGFTWFDAVYFCNKLSEKMSLTPAYNIIITTIDATENGHITAATVTLVSDANGYRLPTEAEWEFAARGGNPSAAAWNYFFSGADTADGYSHTARRNPGLDLVGWYGSNLGGGVTSSVSLSYGTPGYGTHEVGIKAENSLHLFDMSGNVAEWCYDLYEESPATGNIPNPTGATSGNSRIYRGGAYGSFAIYCNVCYRDSYTCLHQGYIEGGIGFRVVRNAN